MILFKGITHQTVVSDIITKESLYDPSDIVIYQSLMEPYNIQLQAEQMQSTEGLDTSSRSR